MEQTKCEARIRAYGSMDSRFRGNDDCVCGNTLLRPIAPSFPVRAVAAAGLFRQYPAP